MSTKSSFPSHIKKLYHASYGVYKNSILSEGLKTGRNPNWNGMDCCGVIYLADDVDVAGSFAECADLVDDDVLDSGICVFEVNVKLLDRSLFNEDPNILFEDDDEVNSFIYPEDVPPSALKVVVENY